MPENSKLGKMAANGIQHWGATLFDFYHVPRRAHFGGLQSTSTGSKLVAWMKVNGEDHAREELELADEEENPKDIFTCDIAKLVEDAGKGGIFSSRWYFPFAFSTSCLSFFLSL